MKDKIYHIVVTICNIKISIGTNGGCIYAFFNLP